MPLLKRRIDMLRIRTYLAGGLLFLVLAIGLWFLIPYQVETGFSTSNYSIGPRSMPYLISVLIMILSIGLIFQSLVLKRDKVIEIEIKDEMRTLLYYGLVVIYVFLMSTVGYLIASFLIGGVTLLFLKVKKWQYYACVVAFITIIYVCFTVLLNVKLP